MKIIFPTGRFISPGPLTFRLLEEKETELWYMGHYISTTSEPEESIVVMDVPVPPVGERGTFTYLNKEFIVVRDDDLDFWAIKGELIPSTIITHLADGSEVEVPYCNPNDPKCWTPSIPSSKQEWEIETKISMIEGIEWGEQKGYWDIDPRGNPQRLPDRFSISAMAEEGKTLMAHLMVDLGFFPSVGQAKKNGWDKPLELGRHELGPKKKRAFVEIVK